MDIKLTRVGIQYVELHLIVKFQLLMEQSSYINESIYLLVVM